MKIKTRTNLPAMVPALFAALLALGCELEPRSVPTAAPLADKRNEGTWYQIMPGSFYDSNGDGIGDLKGVTLKLDYLNDQHSVRHTMNVLRDGECNDSLHIDGIWLTPIMPAPSYHKYDVTDYMAVDPQFGTMDDFRELLDECHKRGIKLVIDLVMNHTSDQHPWFQKALEEVRAGKPGRYAGYYHFYYGSVPPQKESVEYGDAYWEWDSNDPDNPKRYVKSRFYRTWGNVAPGVWYEGSFWTGMPDLNFDSLALREEFEKVAGFWLSAGLDGFRLDATQWLYKLNDPSDKKQMELGTVTIDEVEKNIALWTWFNQVCHKLNDNVYLVGECVENEHTIAEYYRSGMNFFDFKASDNVRDQSSGGGSNWTNFLMYWNWRIKARNPRAIAAPFLSNHDQDRSFYKMGGENWGADPTMRGNDRRRFAASLLLLAPGTPFIYYGEEIGLFNNIDDYIANGNNNNHEYEDGKRAFDDSDRRGPMWWSSTSRYGIPNPPENRRWSERALLPRNGQGGVDIQLANEYSLLRHYIRVSNLKNRYPFIAWGDMEIVETGNSILSAYRITDTEPRSATYGKSVVVAHNTKSSHDGGSDVYFRLPTAKWIDGVSAQDLAWRPAIQIDGETIRMPPFTSAIIGEYNYE